MNNAVTYPKEVRFAGRPTCRTTPIYELQKKLGGQFSISAGQSRQQLIFNRRVETGIIDSDIMMVTLHEPS